MSNDKIKDNSIGQFAIRLNDNSKWDIPTMLSWIKAQPELGQFQSAVVILLDSQGLQYRSRIITCNIKHSETVALLEVVKGDFVSQINGR